MIFGSGKPKFVLGVTDHLLDYSMVTGEFLPEEIEQVSVINGHREFIVKGDYAEFEVLVHLHKYANPRAKFEELYACRGADVVFYPHREGEPLKDGNGNNVLFHISAMVPGYLQNIVNYDILSIRFRSKDFVDLSNNVVYGTPVEEIIMS